MKKIISLIISALALSLAPAFAQVGEYVQRHVSRDSLGLNTTPAVKMDSSLVGLTVYEAMPSASKGDRGSVTIRQSADVARALESKIEGNSFKEVSGYRIRVYFSNARTAREESTSVVSRFREKFPQIPVYHNYVNPNFKVTVGDFRSKSEALELLEIVKRDFPSAFIVKENITLMY